MKHFIKRFELRVKKPWSKKYKEIIMPLVKDGKNFIFRDSFRISHHIINLEDQDWIVVYDTVRHTLVTIMMYNDEYRNKRGLDIQPKVSKPKKKANEKLQNKFESEFELIFNRYFTELDRKEIQYQLYSTLNQIYKESNTLKHYLVSLQDNDYVVVCRKSINKYAHIFKFDVSYKDEYINQPKNSIECT